MNLIMVGSVMMGGSALRRKVLAPWLAWSLLLIFPSAVVASTTLLPTTPSGALWLFSTMMLVCGYLMATGHSHRLLAVQYHVAADGVRIDGVR
jgi:hypothetical protein